MLLSYGYGNYWGGGGLWGAGFYPDILQGGLAPPRDEKSWAIRYIIVNTSNWWLGHQV